MVAASVPDPDGAFFSKVVEILDTHLSKQQVRFHNYIFVAGQSGKARRQADGITFTQEPPWIVVGRFHSVYIMCKLCRAARKFAEASNQQHSS